MNRPISVDVTLEWDVENGYWHWDTTISVDGQVLGGTACHDDTLGGALIGVAEDIRRTSDILPSTLARKPGVSKWLAWARRCIAGE